MPLDRVVLQERAERWTQKPDPDAPGKVKGVLETPKEPVKWPAYIFYFKPILVLLNVDPVLDLPDPVRPAARPLRGQRLGLVLLPDRRGVRHVSPAVHPDAEQPHDRAPSSAFFALYQFLRIWDERRALGLAVRGGRLLRGIRRGERAARPGLPGVARLAAAGPLSPADAPVFPSGGARSACRLRGRPVRGLRRVLARLTSRSGPTSIFTKGASGRRRWSWTRSTSTPSRTAVYLFHMTLGHHGVFSLTPIFLFSAWGAMRLLGAGGRFLTVWTWLTFWRSPAWRDITSTTRRPGQAGGTMHPLCVDLPGHPGFAGGSGSLECDHPAARGASRWRRSPG